MTTNQQQADACREAFEAWVIRTPYGRYSTALRGDSKYDSSHTQLMWSAWQARGEFEAQQRPDLRVVREALEEADQVLARYWFYRNEEDEDNNDDVIACNKNVKKALAALPALALLTTPQAAQEDGWRPMTDSAYEDGEIIGWHPEYGIRTLEWCDESGGFFDKASDFLPLSWVTHWMPLPKPPTALQPTTRDKEGV